MSAGKTDSTPCLPKISVKSLVAFAAKQGSLDRRFTPAPSSQEGIEGHQRVTANRPAYYQSEVALAIQCNGLFIRGRADGYNPKSVCLEEIKTFYGDIKKIPENHRYLHWAQAKMYGWMLCQQENITSIRLALIYFHLKEQREYREEETWDFDALDAECKKWVEAYQAWQTIQTQRLQKLTPWLEQLQFPFAQLHSSQRQMAEAVYLSAVNHRVVLAEAPTGTGKTLAGLFPVLKALPTGKINKVFYLTAKTTGKQLALDTLRLFTQGAASPLRVLELTAQEKACLAPDKQCTGDSCPYAKDFYHKLAAARAAAYEIPLLDKQTLINLATQFNICPFYLSMEMCRWVDIIIADVNYFFDGSPLLLNLTQELHWKPYLLVDECHNLIERGRMMYSASLNRGLLLKAKKIAPPLLIKPLNNLNKHWLNLLKKAGTHAEGILPINDIPPAFIQALSDFTGQYQEFLQHNAEHPLQKSCAQEFFYSALALQSKMTEKNADFGIYLDTQKAKAEKLALKNWVPGALLARRLAFAKGACFFSATLHPQHFYQTMLGLPDNSLSLRVTSPFASDQLKVNIANHLSTRFHHRTAAIPAIATLICQQLETRPGNAMVFVPSYIFLQQLANQLKIALAESPVTLLIQDKAMNEAARENFIGQFNNANNLLGLAVLGGAFSEGIDLPGEALKGVFIATLGLPQVNTLNEHMRQHLHQRFQAGYQFTYLYPGLQKVIQAAGRVIRRKDDTGYLWLLDQRFGQAEIQQLLPDWWRYEQSQIPVANST